MSYYIMNPEFSLSHNFQVELSVLFQNTGKPKKKKKKKIVYLKGEMQRS